MRPTDFCHLNDLRAPVPRAFPAHSATFIAWKPPSFEGAPYEALGVWAPCGLTGGPSVSRHSRTLRRTLTDTRCLASISARALMSVSQVSSVGVFFPRCLSLVEPLTPLSPLPLPEIVRRAFACRSQAWGSHLELFPFACPSGGSRQGRRDHTPVKEHGS